MHPVELETTNPTEFVPLTLIDPNPYQPREKQAPEHVQKIAASIALEGLLQIPTGRRVDGEHGGAQRVQLAFGHTRLAAYFLLYQVQADLEDHKAIDFEDDSLMQQVVLAADTALEKGIRFKAMPVSIREISDEAMFRYAVRENNDREDLTALEKARAMIRYRDEFGKTSAQIGELFGLNEATVRGKLRLLNLPADLQQQLAGVSEPVLREVLYMLELPEEYRQRVEQHYEPFIKPSMILRAAIEGENSGQIGERVRRMLNFFARDLNGDWKHDREEWPGEGILGACKGCAFRRQREGKQLCLKANCFEEKKRVMEREYLADASKACGLPVLEAEKEGGSLSDFGYGDGEKLKTALAVGCENLRLRYDRYGNGRADSDHPSRVKGFPRAEVICSKRNGFCSCSKALSAGVNLAKIAEEKQQAQITTTTTTDGEEAPTPAAPVLTADDLKDVSRAATQQRRQNAEEVKAMRAELTQLIAAALTSDNPAVWLRILQRYEWGLANKHQRKDWQDDWHGHAEELRLEIAKKITEQIYNTSYSEPVPARALSLFNDFLKEARLPIMEPAEELES